MITPKIAALKMALSVAEDKLAIALGQRAPSTATIASLTQEVARLRADLLHARRARFEAVPSRI
jgi:uncharacterized small protein (DUF1192 family)